MTGPTVAGAGRIYLDHLAVGTESWADGYPVLVETLGGRWLQGGDAGEFAPCQLVYRDDMHLEIISPGSRGAGFMRRFLDRSGPGPHHITFNVHSLDATHAKLNALGITTFGGREMPHWRESFLHPKTAGVGTLLQLIESSDEVKRRFRPPTPDGFPPDPPEPADIAWIGLTADSIEFAEALFGEVLGGDITESGAGWRLLSWGPQRRLLVRQFPAEPGAPQLWAVAVGVAHLAIGAADMSPTGLSVIQPQEYDPRLGLRVWSVGN
jgi:Glyoxalase-like domain